MKACLTCGGRYEPLQRDGTLYFHVCPPLPKVRVERLGAERVVDPADVAIGDTELEHVVVDRSDARNENVRIEIDANGNPRSVAIADGRGTIDVAPAGRG